MFPELALWLVPLAVAFASYRFARASLWRNTGFAFGLVVAPASLGLYALYFLGPIAAVLGMLGLILEMLHGAPGYSLALALGLIPSHTVVTGASRVPIELNNAVVWSIFYGVLGWLIDAWSRRRQRSSSNAV